jgi:hypothetical protein
VPDFNSLCNCAMPIHFNYGSCVSCVSNDGSVSYDVIGFKTDVISYSCVLSTSKGSTLPLPIRDGKR